LGYIEQMQCYEHSKIADPGDQPRNPDV